MFHSLLCMYTLALFYVFVKKGVSFGRSFVSKVGILQGVETRLFFQREINVVDDPLFVKHTIH